MPTPDDRRAFGYGPARPAGDGVRSPQSAVRGTTRPVRDSAAPPTGA